METTLDIRPLAKHPNLRAYLTGGGATAALVVGAVIVFLALATFVAFKGLPFGSGSTPEATVSVARGAPEAAAVAASPAAGAVAPAPATPAPAAVAEIVAALPPAETPPVVTPPATSSIDLTGIATGTGGGPPGAQGESGALGNAVGGLESAAGNLGLDLPLTETAGELVAGLDKTVKDTLNGVGGLVGQPELGDRVTSTVNGLTHELLGPDGAADRLLGPGGLTDRLLGG